MGLGHQELSFVADLARSGAFPSGSSVIEIGAQQLSGDLLRNRQTLDTLAKAFSASLPDFGTAPTPVQLPTGQEALDSNAPSARPLWEALGLRYASIDVDGSPGAIPLDLNYDHCPRNYSASFNLVINSGTTEHIANQMNAFKVIHDLCAVNGFMLHVLPAAGMFTHGLFNYTPKFFWMLCRSNCYRLAHMDLGWDGTAYRMISDVVDQVRQFNAEAGRRVSEYTVKDGYLFVAMQKLYNFEYVAPLDVPTGASANKELSERYWTVFKPELVQERIQGLRDPARP